jgi:hypothetical protein
MRIPEIRDRLFQKAAETGDLESAAPAHELRRRGKSIPPARRRIEAKRRRR